jgi:chromate reductase
VVSNSPGAISGFGANQHLRQSMVFLDVPMLQQPEAYIGGVAELFDADCKVKYEKSREFLKQFMNAFAAWVERNARR